MEQLIIEQRDCNTASQNTIYLYLAIPLIKKLLFRSNYITVLNYVLLTRLQF